MQNHRLIPEEPFLMVAYGCALVFRDSSFGFVLWVGLGLTLLSQYPMILERVKEKGGSSAQPRPASTPPKPTAPDLPSSKAEMSLDATLNQADMVLRQAPPILETRVPPVTVSSEAGESAPRIRTSSWQRAMKPARTSVKFGFLLSIAIQIITNQVQSHWAQFEFPFLFRALFTGLVFGLACAVVTYFVSVLYFDAKGARKAADSATPAINQKQNTVLASAGVIVTYAGLWLIATSHGTKPAPEVQTTTAPAAGQNYENRQPVQQSGAEAVTSYVKAAEQGDAWAQTWLGWIYSYGKGVPQSYEEAAKWYSRAALQGNATAQNNLGVMYRQGQGVPQDLVAAYEWFYLAAAQGDTNAVISRDNLSGSMTPPQIAEAKAQAEAEWAREFFETYPDLKPYESVVDAVAAKINESGNLPESREARMEAFAKAARLEIRRQQQAPPATVNNLDKISSLKADAEKGDASSQAELAAFYRSGVGVPYDPVEAYKWYSLAAAQGSALALRNANEVAGSLTAKQLIEARGRITQYSAERGVH